MAAIELSGYGASAYLLTAVVGLLALVVSILVLALIVHSEEASRRIGSFSNQIANPVTGRFGKGHGVDLVPAAPRLRSDIAGLVTRRWSAITGSQVAVSITQGLVFYLALRGVEGWGVAGSSLLMAFGAFEVAQIGRRGH